MRDIFTEFISNWLKELVTLFMIIALIDIIMPKGNMKRYVDFIIGILIIFTVISPLTRFKEVNLDIDREVEAFSNRNLSLDNIEDIRNDQIADLYLTSLSKELKALIEENSEHGVASIEFQISPDEDQLLILDGVDIVLEQKEIERKIRVKDIELGHESSVLTSFEDDDIKGIISTMTQLENDSINIYYNNKEEIHGRTDQ